MAFHRRRTKHIGEHQPDNRHRTALRAGGDDSPRIRTSQKRGCPRDRSYGFEHPRVCKTDGRKDEHQIRLAAGQMRNRLLRRFLSGRENIRLRAEPDAHLDTHETASCCSLSSRALSLSKFSGKVNRNRHPSLTSLSTQILPPCKLIRARPTGSPRPVPGFLRLISL